MSHKRKTDWFKDKYRKNATLIICKKLDMSAEEALECLADSYDKLLRRFVNVAERSLPFSAVLRFEQEGEAGKR